MFIWKNENHEPVKMINNDKRVLQQHKVRKEMKAKPIHNRKKWQKEGAKLTWAGWTGGPPGLVVAVDVGLEDATEPGDVVDSAARLDTCDWVCSGVFARAGVEPTTTWLSGGWLDPWTEPDAAVAWSFKALAPVTVPAIFSELAGLDAGAEVVGFGFFRVSSVEEETVGLPSPNGNPWFPPFSAGMMEDGTFAANGFESPEPPTAAELTCPFWLESSVEVERLFRKTDFPWEVPAVAARMESNNYYYNPFPFNHDDDPK